MVHGWKEGRMDGMIWKYGTKMDNGICILTMPTQNYFTSVWNRNRGEALAKFSPIARLGHYEFNGRGTML